MWPIPAWLVNGDLAIAANMDLKYYVRRLMAGAANQQRTPVTISSLLEVIWVPANHEMSVFTANVTMYGYPGLTVTKTGMVNLHLPLHSFPGPISGFDIYSIVLIPQQLL